MLVDTPVTVSVTLADTAARDKGAAQLAITASARVRRQSDAAVASPRCRALRRGRGHAKGRLSVPAVRSGHRPASSAPPAPLQHTASARRT